MIEPIAEILDIPKTNIIANQILFDEAGIYSGFDSREPTSADLGKPKAIKQILDLNPTYKTVIMIGDGATDAQAKPPASAFIGFGGVVVRDAVRDKADWFVMDFDELTEIVKKR